MTHEATCGKQESTICWREVDACDTIDSDGAVAQWIERRFPKCAGVLTLTLLDWSSVTGTDVTKAQSYLTGKLEGDSSMTGKVR
jgi:hypothetical protein